MVAVFKTLYPTMLQKYPDLLPAQVDLQTLTTWVREGCCDIPVVEDVEKLLGVYHEDINDFMSRCAEVYQGLNPQFCEAFRNVNLYPISHWGPQVLRNLWNKVECIRSRIDVSKLGHVEGEAILLKKYAEALEQKGSNKAAEKGFRDYVLVINDFLLKLEKSPKVGCVPEMQIALYHHLKRSLASL